MPVEIVDYDASWPQRYEDEKGRILAAIGSQVAAVEHIGSTAVPGLAAKPIIDMLVGLRSLDDAGSCIEPLERLGYEYVPEWEDELPDRRYFRRVRPRPRTHHVHMVEVSGAFWRRQLLFRDHLRGHPDDARRYEALKRDLAERFEVGREYAAAKSTFIAAILDEATRAAR